MEPIATVSSAFTLLYGSDQTNGSITVPVPQLAKPVNAAGGLINFTGDSAGDVFNLLMLSFFGAGTSGQTATARITAWRAYKLPATSQIFAWIPVPLLTLNLTLGTQTVPNTGENVVSTITIAQAFTSAYEIISPGADGTLGMVKVDPVGAALIEVDVAVGSASSINGMWAAI